MPKPTKAISAMDAVPLAIEHARKELTAPFRFGFWTRMAVVAIFAGEMSSGFSGFNGNLGNLGQHGVHGRHFAAGLPGFDARILPALVLIALFFVVLMFIFMYIHSVFRFILFSSSLTGNCGLRAQWARWTPSGGRYFIFLIAYSLILWPLMLLVIGLPIFLVWRAGVFNEPSAHLGLLIGGGILFFFFLLCFFLVVLLIAVTVRDFFVPIMALENCSIGEAWERFKRVLLPERSSLAIYFLLKAALAIGVAVLVGLADLLLIVVLLIPIIVLVLLVVAIWQVSHAAAILLGVVFGTAGLAVMIYAMAMVAVPPAIFFQMYSLYFLGWRYEPLGKLLWPPEPPPAEEPPAPPAPIMPEVGPLPAPA